MCWCLFGATTSATIMITSPGWPTHPGVAQHNVITWLYVSILPMTDIDSGNGLLSEGTKPLAEPILKIIPGMMYVIRGGISSIS